MPSMGKTILDGLLLSFIFFTILAATSGGSQEDTENLQAQLQAAHSKIADLMTQQQEANKTIADLKSNLQVAKEEIDSLGKLQAEMKRETQQMVYVQSH